MQATGGLTVPWTGHTGWALAQFLARNKTWSADILVRCVHNRFASEGINPAEDPIRWISKLPNYALGPLNKFGKPKKLSQEEVIARYWDAKTKVEG
jgi:hypothetical protein